MLANVYLHELDTYVQRYTGLSTLEKTARRKHGNGNYVYVRYADDFVVFSNSTRRETEALKEELTRFLHDSLKLTLSAEKTKITHLNDGIEFLGFRVKRRMAHSGMRTTLLIPKDAVKRVLQKIAHTTAPSTHHDSVNTKILAVNRILSGWASYYQYTGRASTTFNQVDHRTFWYVVHWVGRKFRIRTPEILRRFGRRKQGRIWLGTSQYQLIKAHVQYPTAYYRGRFLKPNPYTTPTPLKYEELPRAAYWTGAETRPGMADLRPLVLERDHNRCQQCGAEVSLQTAEVDHIRPVRRFRRPVDANTPKNLRTLCHSCHRAKTETDRQMESPVH